MTLTSESIGTLVTRIQADFLENPGLGVTLDQAERRYGVDRATCEAVLEAFVDGHVLTRSTRGTYRRRVATGNRVARDPWLTTAAA